MEDHHRGFPILRIHPEAHCLWAGKWRVKLLRHAPLARTIARLMAVPRVLDNHHVAEEFQGSKWSLVTEQLLQNMAKLNVCEMVVLAPQNQKHARAQRKQLQLALPQQLL